MIANLDFSVSKSLYKLTIQFVSMSVLDIKEYHLNGELVTRFLLVANS